MSEEHKRVIEGLDVLKEKVKALEAQSNTSKEFVVLNDFPDLIEKYCISNGIKKSDICELAGISSTTLTQALKNPLKSTMSTITSLANVIGYQVLIGRS